MPKVCLLGDSGSCQVTIAIKHQTLRPLQCYALFFISYSSPKVLTGMVQGKPRCQDTVSISVSVFRF